MNRPDFVFTAKEQEVLTSYSESLEANSMKDVSLSYARKLIHVSEPECRY